MESAQETVRLSAAALMAATGESKTDLAAGVGLTQPKVSRRQSGHTAWTLADCDQLAEHYGITVLDLLAGPTTACRALPAERRARRLGRTAASAAHGTATVSAGELAVPPEAAAGEGPAAASGPCVLCGQPASDVVEGFIQHLDPAGCAQPTTTPAKSAAAPPAKPEPAIGIAASNPARKRPAPRRPRSSTNTDPLPVDEIHQVVVAEATKAGGDLEAATAALVKRAIPDAMALWHLTRVGSRYDVLFNPPRPDILRRRTRNGPDDIWEARPKWHNTAMLKDSAGSARQVAVLDINGAYLAAMKAHLPHKELEHSTSGAYDRRRSGVYLITPPAWEHEDLPNPIGNRDQAGQLWITDATLRLLLRASGPKYGLCQPPKIHESWTAASSESLLDKFRETLAAARAEAIAGDDAMTLEYVKAMYSKFVSTCGESTHNREITRPEWMHIIHSQAFANLWWKAYKAHGAGLTVVKMAGTDELHVTGGDWRTVFDEGRGLAEVKLKDTYLLGAEGGEG